MRKNAFTLVELLVVIGIVAVLTVIISGVTVKARESAQNAKCVSNLRTIGSAALRFFADRNGDFLPTKYWELYPSWSVTAKQGMRDYLGIESDLINPTGVPEFYRDTVATCPSMRRLYPKVSTPLHRTYTYNYYLNQKNPSSAYDSLPSIMRPDLATGYRRLSNVSKPAAMWMFTEGVIGGDGSYFGTSLSSASSEPDMSFPHRGKQNFVFLDGHIEALGREEFRKRAEKSEFWGKVD
jgi:general secretion pathway protein G